MSLVAYGSSDESNDEEEASDTVYDVGSLIERTRTVLSLPVPKDLIDTVSNSQSSTENNNINTRICLTSTGIGEPILFKNLPKPKQIEIGATEEMEDDIIPPKKETKILQEKQLKKNRAPVKISLSSLSEFKDVDEERDERKRNRIKPSEKGTGLFSILPLPKGSSTKATIKSLIPNAVKKVLQPCHPIAPRQVKIMPAKTVSTIIDDSDSDDESSDAGHAKCNIEGKIDFFSLANSSEISPRVYNSCKDFFSLSEKELQLTSAKSSASNNTLGMYRDETCENVSQDLEIPDQKLESQSEKTGFSNIMECRDKKQRVEIFNKTLTSNVINLPKEEIRMKNKAEVGPKLPIPEQEYNVDSQGNVAFDEKAIEYLCGKRGVKRKNKDFDEANIIEINGEDIKPDEREWLVKALTEEAADRPVSMESAGPSTQSRKKHQITYLAHQAKAMEVELKNQWAQNKVTRKQTQSKYGF